jgi:hypothetical protein
MGTLLTDPLEVRALDPTGLPLAGAQITFAIMDGGGEVEPTLAVTDDAGLASTRLRLGPPGAQRVRADGLGASVTFLARSDEPGAMPTDASGCGCRVSRRAAGEVPPILIVIAAVIAIRARRRR